MDRDPSEPELQIAALQSNSRPFPLNQSWVDVFSYSEKHNFGLPSHSKSLLLAWVELTTALRLDMPWNNSCSSSVFFKSPMLLLLLLPAIGKAIFVFVPKAYLMGFAWSQWLILSHCVNLSAASEEVRFDHVSVFRSVSLSGTFERDACQTAACEKQLANLWSHGDISMSLYERNLWPKCYLDRKETGSMGTSCK